MMAEESFGKASISFKMYQIAKYFLYFWIWAKQELNNFKEKSELNIIVEIRMYKKEFHKTDFQLNGRTRPKLFQLE